MPSVCYRTPNLYFLFWAMGIHNLKQDSELVYIVPRSWTSGAYFKRFRQYLFKHCVIKDMPCLKVGIKSLMENQYYKRRLL